MLLPLILLFLPIYVCRSFGAGLASNSSLSHKKHRNMATESMPAAAESKRFLRFVMTSGFAAAVNLGSRWIFSHYMSFEWAVIVAFFFGVTTAYALARKYVFRNSGRSIQSEFRRFVAVNLLALGLVWTIR